MTEASKSTNGAFGRLRVGIVRLDGWGDDRTTGTGGTVHEKGEGKDLVKGYVPIRGDVDDARSYEGQPFTMVATVAKGCTWDVLRPDLKEWWDGGKTSR
jgi:hypothetical protein